MKPVIVAERARRDLARLAEWLRPKSGGAADRAADALAEAIASLAEMPERGEPVGGRVRELPVRFGRYGYVLRYRVSKTAVVITRAYHARERR